MGRQAASASCRPCDCGLRAARGLTNLGTSLSNAGFPASRTAATNTVKTQLLQSKLTPGKETSLPKSSQHKRRHSSSGEAVVVPYLNLARRDCPYAFRGPLSGFPWRRESVILLSCMSFTETAPPSTAANRRVSGILTLDYLISLLWL